MVWVRYNEEHRLLQETLATRRKIAEEELAVCLG